MAQLDQLIRGFEPTLTEDYTASSAACEFITGPAGCGKTYLTRKKIEDDPTWGMLCATTGIAAVNLGAVTLNSILKFFDTDSLRDRFNRGGLTSTLHQIGRKVRKVVIDEASMMDGRQLDYIYQAMLQVNEYQDMQKQPMGITLVGDVCQLAPVKAPWIFESECWEHFERNTTRLTKIYRQDNPQFLEAINAARAGEGRKCADILVDLGVKFLPATNKNYDGTTIMSKNDQVDNFNFSALLDLKGDAFGLKSLYWGVEDKNWKKHIPEVLKLKVGAYVMLLQNSFLEGYVNGDCGHIVEKSPTGTILVKLLRTGQVVGINPIVRSNTCSQEEADKQGFGDPNDRDSNDLPIMEHVRCNEECGADMPNKKWVWGKVSYNCQRGNYNVGGVKFYPIRLAYATTVHKSQGLTLDKCQIDVRDHFFGSPSMMYVALSRCRTHEGLTIVGTPQLLAERTKLEPKVRRWL